MLRNEGEGYLISDVMRNVSFSRLDADVIDTAVVWPLDRFLSARRVSGGRRWDWQKTVRREPTEVDNLIADDMKATSAH